MTINELKGAVNAGLKELTALVSNPKRPKNWFDQIPQFEKTLTVLKNEIEKREKK